MRRLAFTVLALVLLSCPAFAWIAQRAAAPDTWNDAAIGTAPPHTATKIFARNITTGQNYYAVLPDTVGAANEAASIMKLYTAVIVAREIGVYGSFTMSSTTTVISGENVSGTTCSLQVGDVISVAALLHCLLMPSGNDAAEVLARYTGTAIRTRTGSGNTGRVRFVEAENALAAEIGASSTTIESPHGVNYSPDGANADENFTTARDIGRILKLAYYDASTQALTSPSLQAIGGTASYTVTITGANARSYGITHTSPMVTPTADGNLIAQKTGSSPAADYNTATLWQAPNNDWIETVLLGTTTSSGDRYADARGVWYEIESDWPTLAGAVGTDSQWTDVIFLSGADPGTTDESASPLTLTAHGATRSTTNPPVGTHSYNFVASSSQYISSPDATKLNIGSSDMCMEAWIRGSGTAPNGGAAGAIAGQYYRTANKRAWSIQYESATSTWYFYASGDGSSFSAAALALSTLGYSADIYFNGDLRNIKACREGGVISIWGDGVKGGTNPAFAGSFYNSDGEFQIGARQESPGSENFFNGYIDELRVTKANRGFAGAAKIPIVLKAFPRSGP